MIPVIIGAIAAAALTAVVVVLVMLHFDQIKQWFMDTFYKKGKIKKDDVSFMLNQEMKDGNYKVLTGVFNKKTGKVHDEMQDIRAEELDDTLEGAFEEQNLVLME